MKSHLADLDLHRAIRRFEHAIVLALVAIMMFVIVVSMVDLVGLIVQDLATPPVVLLRIDELLDILGLVLIVLIAIELLETFKIYMHSHLVKVELVLEVAMIAVARKIIVVDFKELGAVGVVSLGALVLALAAACYLEQRARRSSRAVTRTASERTAA